MDHSRRPGDGGSAARLARMIRVDQAGEYGAARIYAGQMAVLGQTGRTGRLLREMAEKEREHLQAFDALLNARSVRPTLLSPLWHAAGFALGAATALAGPRMAMACTEAVESVIADHYAEQRSRLGDSDPEFAALIDQAREDEIAHHDLALEEGAARAPAHDLATRLIRRGTRAAIWLSERL